MKVLYLIETLGVGGAEQSLLQILPRLCVAKPVVCHIYEGSDLKPAYEAAGVTVVSLNIPPKYRFSRAIRQIAALARKEQPDLIHTTLFRAEIVGRIVGRRLGIPVISSFVSECYADIRWAALSPIGRLKLKSIQAIDRLTAPLASHFIANSHAVMRSQIRALRVPQDKVTVIYRGRDPRAFVDAPSLEDRQALRRSLEIDAAAPIVLNVGRLLEGKGQRELIEAFGRIASTVPDAVLVIAGEGPDRGLLERQIRVARLDGRVRLLGLRQDVPRLLAFASVFAFPSHHEGHPGALVEAMFAGLPIVVSDIPVHLETIEHGETGLTAAVRSPEHLAEALLRMLQNPAHAAAMGRRARDVAAQRFHVDRAAQQYDALYRRVVEAFAARRSRHGGIGVVMSPSRREAGRAE